MSNFSCKRSSVLILKIIDKKYCEKREASEDCRSEKKITPVL